MSVLPNTVRQCAGQALLCVILPATLLCAGTGAQAAPNNPPPLLSLQEAMQRTLQQNPTLAVFDFRQKMLDGRAYTAGLNPGVRLETEFENIASGDDGEEPEVTVALSSVIELGGKRSARDQVVGGERLVLDSEQRLQALQLMGEVTRRYVRVVASAERQRLADDTVRLALDTLNAVSAKVSAGGAPQAEKRRAEAALIRARIVRDRVAARHKTDRVILAGLWGDTASASSGNFRVDGSVLYQLGSSGEFNTFFQRARQNPVLTRFASEERLRAAQLRLAESERSPDIQWAMGLRGTDNESGVADSGSLVLGFSAPLFSSARARGSIASARAALDSVAVEERAALLKIYTQLYDAFFRREQAIQSCRQLRSQVIPLLTTALEETERYYRNGRYGYLEWVAAREELLGARRLLIGWASEALLAGAEIEQLTAVPLTVSSPAESVK
ncbi:TolC family protein [Microbulbifer aggregans]|uniref:TolC family protein n=1 Tax=Microbulbifer aggregans TaxID=1769779 RepID=UPI001CFD4800|nr:TolC family protein [Microbulbifer aggregans]